ncbi:SRPBCC domain-containing protein [Streptomyces polyrhachis]|uniref:SRPBCC domain-containing protein n=1 Tax=Streptomyces polyrhachis TaxID=1282885 RepID=A0ABW2GFP5_9ACTN
MIQLSYTYEAELTEVWDALTNAERLSRWYGPIQGDLQQGGTYRLFNDEGNSNERGKILLCEPPYAFKVQYTAIPTVSRYSKPCYPEEFAAQVAYAEAHDDDMWIEVRLERVGDRTTLVLQFLYAAPDEQDLASLFGPCWIGYYVDAYVLSLDRHLRGKRLIKGWENTAAGKRAAVLSAQEWGKASVAAGFPADEVAEQVEGLIFIINDKLTSEVIDAVFGAIFEGIDATESSS